jgi:HAD superfamily hydrolase (TIGR01509 family)
VAGDRGLIIFDCDGVLVDSEPIAMRVLLETLRDEGLRLDAETGYDRLLGRSLGDIRDLLANDFGLTLDDGNLAGMRLRLYAAFRAELRAAPGVAEAIGQLEAPFCVASSSQPERIRLSLEVTGLLPHFEGRIFSSSMVARGKPAPDLFLHAAREMGFAPAACLVVEDSPAGIRAGLAAGMQVVAYLGGIHAQRPGYRERVVALRPHRVIADMRDLIGSG